VLRKTFGGETPIAGALRLKVSSTAVHGVDPPVSGSGAAAAVSVVLPTMNEARNLPWVLERMPEDAELILVDGRSIDGTVAVATALRPDIRVISEPRRGKGRALRAGFAAATGDAIVMIDGDGSMDPLEIPRYVELLGDYDFVKGSRYISGGDSDDFTWLRRTGNRALLALANGLFRAPFTDLCYGFCAFRREYLGALALTADGFEIETELVIHAVKAGLRIAEVPSVELSRLHGDSHLRTFRDGQRVLRTLLHERLVPPPAGEPAPRLGALQALAAGTLSLAGPPKAAARPVERRPLEAAR
jgi:glycosyltransferase involved in cell wall biosynthesis